MWLRSFALTALAFALWLSAPDQAVAKSVHKEFVEGWSERLERYEANFETAKSNLNEASAAFSLAAQQNDPNLQAHLTTLLRASDELGYHAGRTEQAQALVQFMEKKPTFARAELWLQEQISALDQAERDTKANFERVSVMKIGEAGVTGTQLLTEMGSAVFRGGALRGQFDELNLINDNLGTYYRAKGEQDAANRAKWAAILGSLGQSLQAQSQAQNSFMMNCTTTGNFTNCMGN